MSTIQVRCGGPCGEILQVQPHGTGLVEFVCPHCGAKNQISYHRAASSLRLDEVTPPSWWRAKPADGEHELVPLGDEDICIFQQLVDQTWRNVSTRDRGAALARLKVVAVQQNCNPRLWRNYMHACAKIRTFMDGERTIECLTSNVLKKARLPFGDLATDINEFLLFRGTKPSACDSICKSDFMVALAGSNAGTLYGPGIYLGENSSKSDEYASDDATGIYKGLYAMLLCRAACGRIQYTDAVVPDVPLLIRRCTADGEFDSVLGDREKARGTYREFVVYNNSQVYPEYVMIYRREAP